MLASRVAQTPRRANTKQSGNKAVKQQQQVANRTTLTKKSSAITQSSYLTTKRAEAVSAISYKPIVAQSVVISSPTQLFKIPSSARAQFHSLSPSVRFTPTSRRVLDEAEKPKQKEGEAPAAAASASASSSAAPAAPANGEADKKVQQELAAKDAKIKELEEKIKAVTSGFDKDVKDLKSRLIESLADKENLRKIMLKDVENAKDFGIKAFATKLFDIIDHMNIVITNFPEKSEDENVAVARETFIGAKDKFLKVMKDYGVEELNPPIGEKFDPFQHSAIFTTPPTEPGHKANHIALVFKTGWQRKGQALRPAQVGVYASDFKAAETK